MASPLSSADGTPETASTLKTSAGGDAPGELATPRSPSQPASCDQRAVVATDVGGLGQAVADAGVLVPPDDATALADAIDRLADDSVAAARLGERAARRASEVFGFDVQVERYLALYHRVVAGDPEPGAALGPA